MEEQKVDAQKMENQLRPDKTEKQVVGLIFGGRSAEHEVSFLSAKNIFAALNKERFHTVLIGVSRSGSWYQLSEMGELTSLDDEWAQTHAIPLGFIIEKGRGLLLNLRTQRPLSIDIGFPILHGTYGEDGCLQGFFKTLNIPFVGCGVLASAASMDKAIMKALFSQAGIPNAASVLLRPWSPVSFEALSAKLGLPFFIKPANAGSSVGVHKIRTEEEYKKKLPNAFLYDTKVLAERFIQGREVEVSVLGLNQKPLASEPGEIIVHRDFYSYEAKYLDSTASETRIPAALNASTKERLQSLAIQAFQAVEGTGFARVDFFVQDGEPGNNGNPSGNGDHGNQSDNSNDGSNDGSIFINEINTLPGFTPISMYPKMWEASGISYSDLITKIIDLGLQQAAQDQKLKTTF